MQDATNATSSDISLYEARPFFEKALRYGISTGIIPAEKLIQFQTDGPKGMVQIARYFGTEFLQPELDRARERMVGLISLYLEDSSDGDLAQAATSLRDHSLLSRSKAGSDMLKSLLTMADSTHFGLSEGEDFHDDQIPLLGKWTQKTLAEYRSELAYRLDIKQKMDAAFWFARSLGMPRKELKAACTEASVDCEAIIRTCLLVSAAGLTRIPSWAQFEAAVVLLRKKSIAGNAGNAGSISLKLPKDLPVEFKPLATAILKAMVRDDVPKILDAAVKPQKLFFQNLTLLGRYFWLDDGLDEITEFERTVSTQWAKLTQGHTDDSSLLTLFLTIAAGVASPKTLLTPTGAAALLRKLRKTGLDSEAVTTFLRDFAPHESQSDYRQLWLEFLGEAQRNLLDERDTRLTEGLAALQLHCNVVASEKKPAPQRKKPSA